jgi:hypothetical protein
MENQVESQSFSWFDELPVIQAPVENARQSSPSMFAIQHVVPSRAIVVVSLPPVREQRAPIWLLAFAAIAGASTFVLGVALISLL